MPYTVQNYESISIFMPFVRHKKGKHLRHSTDGFPRPKLTQLLSRAPSARLRLLGLAPVRERSTMPSNSPSSSPTTAATPASAPAPSLVKTLGLTGAVGFGLAYMMPMASFTTYGVVNTMTEGAIVTSYVVTLIAMLFTASSYASMAGAFPTTGAAYTYTR